MRMIAAVAPIFRQGSRKQNNLVGFGFIPGKKNEKAGVDFYSLKNMRTVS